MLHFTGVDAAKETVHGHFQLGVRGMFRAILTAAYNNQVHIRRNKHRAISNCNGSLELVTSGDPDINACPLQVGNRLGHAVLQTVLDGRRAKQDEVALKLIGECLHALVTVLCCDTRVLVLTSPCLVLLRVEFPHCRAQRP